MSLELRCVICAEPVPEDRAKRGACTCSKEHGRELNKRKRNAKAGSSFRLCGRRLRKTKTVKGVICGVEVEIRQRAESAQVNQ